MNDEIKKQNERNKQPDIPEEEIPFNKAKMALFFDQIYRIKRFLLIYHNFRLTRIEEQFWHFGGDLKNNEKEHVA